MELFRCRICGEVYFGAHPSHCPYCGAHKGYLVPIAIWKDENLGFELINAERDFVKETQKLEYENTRFYRAASKASESVEISAYFKYLAKIENEHYNIACKLLGEDKDNSIFDPSEEKGSDRANIEESISKEDHASKLYASFIPKSENNRIKTFFKALSEVEADHIKLDNIEIKNI